MFGGLHLLPFFRPFDGADAGFDPVDHLEVDPRLGTWEDVRALGASFELTADVIVNHVSAASPQFADVVERGAASPHAGMFLTLGGVFPEGATEADLLKIYRPRPGLPLTPVTLGGERRLAWTTFTPDQIDLDVAHPATVAYHDAILDRMAGAGVRLLRLDAVGYAVKTAGTSCFMTPETFAFIDDLTARGRARGLEVLVEIHSHHSRQVEVGARVDRVYDFALPPLVLHALTAGDPAPLRRWLEMRPANAITVLDTHDGIGVIDVAADGASPELEGLLDAPQIDALVEAIHANSGGASRRATGAAASNVDLYQVNCTFYDALARDDERYLLARALQLWVPGIPQVYYVGLLAGENDVALLERTGVGRDINRRHYSEAEVVAAVRRPVVARLLELIRLRNSHPAFGGEFECGEPEPGVLELAWRAGPRHAILRARLAAGAFELDVG